MVPRSVNKSYTANEKLNRLPSIRENERNVQLFSPAFMERTTRSNAADGDAAAAFQLRKYIAVFPVLLAAPMGK